jgi:folylpolyglutamate synthase/dihydropteroate synthase
MMLHWIGLNRHYKDTDELNAQLSLIALCLLQKHHQSFRHLPVHDVHAMNAVWARPSCRWEKHRYQLDSHQVEVVLDVGHNPAAIQALVNRMQREYSGKNVRMIYAMSRDKDVRACLRSLAQALPASHIHFAQVHEHFRASSLWIFIVHKF